MTVMYVVNFPAGQIAIKSYPHLQIREYTLAYMAKRKAPGSTGKGKFYRIELRPKGQFSSFRVQDVGKKGGLERLAGHRPSGSWDTVSWLIAKDKADMVKGYLKITGQKERSILNQIKGHIVHVKGDIFRAHPRNVPEAAKPTLAMRRAQKKRKI